MNADPYPGQKITKLISTHLLRVEKKNMFKAVPTPDRIRIHISAYSRDEDPDPWIFGPPDPDLDPTCAVITDL